MDPDRLNALLAELESDPGYATGAKRFPRRLTGEEAAAVADEVHAAVEEVGGDRARTARAQGTPLACTKGCAYCCEEMIMVPAPETHAAARWLAREENRAAREAFLAAFPGWREQVGDTPERLADATARGDLRAHQSIYLAHFKKRVVCAFNREGLCSIYPARPTVCRTAHAVGDPEACRADAPGTPRRLDFVPLARLVARTNDSLIAAHHALGAPRGRPRSLCVAVHDLLTRDTAR